MIKYEYKKSKFLKDGHTMFEGDVLQDLKRLAYLEDKISKEFFCEGRYNEGGDGSKEECESCKNL